MKAIQIETVETGKVAFAVATREHWALIRREDLVVAFAAELYLELYEQVKRGAKIVFRRKNGSESRAHIPLEWQDSGGTVVNDDAQEKTESMNVKLSDNLLGRMESFVANGGAPSLRALLHKAIALLTQFENTYLEGGEVLVRLQDSDTPLMKGTQ